MSLFTNSKVPLYAKVGWIVTWGIMIVLVIMLSKNLIGSIVFGPITEKKDMTIFYDLGVSDALSGKPGKEVRGNEKNPLLKKSYTKGYQEGLDRKWHQKKD